MSQFKVRLVNNVQNLLCWLTPKTTVKIFKKFSKPFWLLSILITALWFFYLPDSVSFIIRSNCRTIFFHFNLYKLLLKELSIEGKQYPNYYEDNFHSSHFHSNWTFKISRHYDEKRLRPWTEPNRSKNKGDAWPQGENGQAFVPSNEEDKATMNQLQDEHKYNIFASERMSLHRSLPDYRFNECRKLSYPEKLPTVSVIIVIHNEAWSALLRTVWSVIDRSPRELVHEIILVDDASTWPALKRPLDDYVELLPANIRIIRTAQREGLIRARLIGARNSTVT